MAKGSRTGKKNSGFTLIETVAALFTAAVLAVFISGFIHPQMKLYYDWDRISQAKAMCSEAYRGLEEKLRYGYVFFCDSRDTGVISYYVRNRQEIPDRRRASHIMKNCRRWRTGRVSPQRSWM